MHLLVNGGTRHPLTDYSVILGLSGMECLCFIISGFLFTLHEKIGRRFQRQLKLLIAPEL